MRDRRISEDSDRRSRERGFVLVPVLFALSLLGLVAVLLTRSAALEVKVEGNLARQAEAEALADGIARLVARYLVVNPPQSASAGKLAVNGVAQSCRASADAVIVTVTDAAGQIDLNAAPQDVLERLFLGLDLTQGDATRLAAAIIDFRDLDDVPLLGGESEAAEYRAAGLPYGPKNAPFATVDELAQVPGITPALFARLRPLVTVSSSMPSPDLEAASPQILAMSMPATPPMRTARRAFLIRVAVRHGAGARATREALIDLSSRAPSGFLWRQWSRGEDDAVGFAADADESGASCVELLTAGE
jgi:general secretion pathway protein K